MSDLDRLELLRKKKRIIELRSLQSQQPQTAPSDLPVSAGGQSFAQAKPERSLGEKVEGVIDTGLALGTGATGGALGFGVGSIGGAFGELTGILKPGEGLELAQKLGSMLTREPRSDAGKELIGDISEILGVLPPVGLTGGVTPRIMAPKSRVKVVNVLAREIEAGNINAGNIAKTLDANGKLIKNPNLKTAIKLMGNDDAAYSSAINFEKMNDATRFQVNKMLDVLESNKRSGDPTRVIENRPANIIGESLAKRVQILDGVKKKASADINKIVSGDIGKKSINTNAARDKFVASLRESDIDVGFDADGNLVADTSRTLANTGEVLSNQKLNNILSRLQNEKMSVKEAHKIKRNVRELVTFDPAAPGATKVSAEIESTIKNLASDLNSEIGLVSKEYKNANLKFSESIDVLKEVDRMLGKRLMVGDDLAVNKLGALSKRIGTNLASREDVLAMVDGIDTALNKRKIFPKDNIKQQVAAIADLEKIFKLESEQAPFGFQARIAQGAGEAAITGGLSLKRDAVLGVVEKFRGMNKLEFDDKIKALRALSKKRGK